MGEARDIQAIIRNFEEQLGRELTPRERYLLALGLSGEEDSSGQQTDESKAG